MVHCHILLLTFPAQGHINPSLQFAKRLVSMGVHVTFATSLSAQRRMTAGTPEGLKFVAFSDGYDDGFKPGDDIQHYYSQMKKNSSRIIRDIITTKPEALKAIQNYNLIGIGPLIPSSFLDGQDPSDTSFGGDLFQKSREYIEWLNSKPQSSVVYISFGTMIVLPKQQKEEIAQGLLETHRPFLWVMRPKESREEEKEVEDEGALSCMEELEQQVIIVPWCSQLEVLSHPSLGCFVTHCGWNSALESLASGVPVVAVPGWSDQGTNAKMMTEVWGTGVRVKANEEGIVESEEVKRCIEEVMGGEERGEEMRRNAKKWKELTREAVKEGGSSDLNLKAFVEEIGVGGRDCSSSV
ncbi:hypothetical protein ACSBR2_012773 [Camellia fascicularis]